MSEDRKPSVGDRVRVTYEAVAYQIADDGTGFVNWVKVGDNALGVPAEASLEVLEPADDPSKSLRGEVRKGPEMGFIMVATDWTGFRWANLHAPAGDNHYSDSHVVGWEVIGAVPGTPAAEQHMHNAGYCGACNMVHDRREYVPPVAPEVVDASTLFPPPVGTAPRVFKSDDPEPPEDVTVLEKLNYAETRGFPFTKRGAYGWVNCETADSDTSGVHGFNWPPGYNMTFREVIA